jgi:hypothetical protein
MLFVDGRAKRTDLCIAAEDTQKVRLFSISHVAVDM